jgi:hypothetical protein
MDKYKIIGTLNFIFGSGMLGISLMAFLLISFKDATAVAIPRGLPRVV